MQTRTTWFDLSNTLAFAAIVEIGTAVVLLIAPTVVERWLLGAGESSVVLGRLFGVALLSLGVACWPAGKPPVQAFRGMLIYNVSIALFLAVLAIDRRGGALLWPVVGLHAILASSLVWTMRRAGS